MHVLVLSAGFPTSYNPMKAIFHQDQANALYQFGLKVGVVAVVPIAFSELVKSRKINFGRKAQLLPFPVFLHQFLSFPKSPSHRIKKVRTIGLELYEEYVSENGVPDLIHVHGYETTLLAEALHDKHGQKLIYTEHSSLFLNHTYNSWQQHLCVKLAALSSICIGVSSALCASLTQLTGSAFTCVPNVVDTDFFKPSLGQKNKDSSYHFVSAGNLKANKNHQMLIHSFVKAFAVSDPVRLSIAGDGPLKADLIGIVNREGRSNQITILGYQTREQLRDLFQESDSFVLTSKHETFGIVLIEAMSMGLPVISSKCGGPESFVTQEVGRLYDGTHEALVELMCHFADRKLQFSPDAIRAYIQNRYSQEAVAKQLIACYNQI